ncbi:hypothetical protein [uncultured Campylobacter sp.]|uniref:hypothetical protein n=1 Tax=uncultured Campylobacter sp. TaxID=218934 RepID=UPI002623E978|nr:hypothetical protein [uncultured Campylobacter sp.]
MSVARRSSFAAAFLGARRRLCKVKFKEQGSNKAMNLNLTLCLRDKILKSVPPLGCLSATEKRA